MQGTVQERDRGALEAAQPVVEERVDREIMEFNNQQPAMQFNPARRSESGSGSSGPDDSGSAVDSSSSGWSISQHDPKASRASFR